MDWVFAISWLIFVHFNPGGRRVDQCGKGMFPRFLARALPLFLASAFSVWIYRRVWCNPSSVVGERIHSGKNAELKKSLFFGDEQCAVAFPGLTREVENATGEGHFELRRLRDDLPGLVQGRIKDGKVGVFLFPRARWMRCRWLTNLPSYTSFLRRLTILCM